MSARRLAVAALALTLTVAAPRVQAAPAPRPHAVFTEGRSGQGQLRIERGVPVLTLRGTPREMGRQHGELLKDEIRTLYDDYLVAFVGGPAMARVASATASATLMTHVPDRFREEMEGLAEGAGLPMAAVVLAQAFLDLKKSVQCSTLAATGPAAADGEPLLARNLDFPSLGLAQRYSLVIVREPDRGPRTVTVGWPMLLGTLSGLSERGLALAMMEVYDGGTSTLSGMPYALLYRQTLEEATTVDEALAHLGRARRTTTNNVTLVDAAGGAAVAELSPERVAIRRPSQGVVMATNHFRAEPHRHGEACPRYARLRRDARERARPYTAADLEGLLAEVALGRDNLQAMILMPRARALRLAIGRAPAAAGPYVLLDRGLLFGQPRPSPPRSDTAAPAR